MYRILIVAKEKKRPKAPSLQKCSAQDLRLSRNAGRFHPYNPPTPSPTILHARKPQRSNPTSTPTPYCAFLSCSIAPTTASPTHCSNAS